MLQQKVIITNEIGIHARPATQLIEFLNNFKSEVTIINGDKTGNARSILNLLALCVKHNTEIIVEVSGEDEEKALPQIIDFLKNIED